MQLNKFVLSILISIFLLSSQVHSAEAPENNYQNLFVSIKNLGTENCQLVEHTINNGTLCNSNIPRILDTTGEKFVFIVNGYRPEVFLKYDCGSHKTFSLYMKHHLKDGYRHTTINAYMYDAIDVNETHKVTRGVRICDSDGFGGVTCYTKAGKINWTISH